jgi:putative intracellular protease/amidase
MNLLMVLTSHEEFGTTGYQTGLWLECFATAYYAFTEVGADLTLASPRGGSTPVDPRSIAGCPVAPSVERFRGDMAARILLSDALRLEQVDIRDFDGAYFPGGHGALWDLATDLSCQRITRALLATGKPLALCGHGPAALINLFDGSGRPLVSGVSLTCFSNSEESGSGLDRALPYFLQDELIRLGAHYSKAPDGTAHVIQHGTLITSQNAASGLDAAHRLLQLLRP